MGAAGLAWLAVTVAGRVAFPWPLEWMEGSVLHHGLRLVSDEAVFAAPSARFVPYLYPPLGYLPFGLASEVLGESLPAARVASLLALAATLGLLGRASAHLAGPGGWRAGLLAAGLYAWGFSLTGAFYDLVRVDAIFLLFLAAATERLAAGRAGSALALLAVSVFAKQHGLIFLGAATAALLSSEPRRHAPIVGGVWLGLGGSLVAAHLLTDGWFTTYVWGLTGAHPLHPGRALGFLLLDLPRHLPLLAVAAGVGVWRERGHPRGVDALLAAGIAVGGLGFAHQGGFDNARMPTLALLAVVAAPVLQEWLEGGPSLRRAVAALALLGQVGLLAWWPPQLWPRAESAERFEALVEALETCGGGGPGVAVDHALLTGEPFLHAMELNDVLLGGGPLARSVADEVERALAAPDAPAAIALGTPFLELDRAVSARYRRCRRLPGPSFPTGFQPPDPVIWAREPAERR